MKEKKILYITNYPMDSSASAAIRNRAFVEGLLKNDCIVHTLTRPGEVIPVIDNIEEYYFENYSTIYKIANKVKKNNVLWKMRVYLSKIISNFNIYDNQRILLKDLDKVKLPITEYDMVISSSDSKVSHLITEELLKSDRLKTSKWIQYWGDPFYKDINDTNTLFLNKIKKEEKRMLSEADFILYTSPFTLEEQKKLYPESGDKMGYIPTPYIREKLYPKTRNKRFKVGYYGSYFKRDRNVSTLYEVAKKMEHIDFEFIGATDLNLEERSNIRIRGQVPNSEIYQYEKECDLLVCVGNKSTSVQIPGKLYHLAATNKSILYIYEKGNEEIARYFSKFDRYNFCENTEDEIFQILEKLSIEQKESLQPIKEFSCEHVVKKMLMMVYNYSG